MPVIQSATLPGVVRATTTSGANAVGLSADTAVYSVVQGDAEGIVTVSSRPDNVIKSLISGSAAAGVALARLINTVASTTGLLVTATATPTVDMDGGTLYCIKGANRGQSRVVTTWTSGVSVAVTVPFTNDIAVDDEFLIVPQSNIGTGTAGDDGIRAVQLTTLRDQVDGSIASGTGIEATVVELDLNERDSSYVLFLLRDHIYSGNVVA